METIRAKSATLIEIREVDGAQQYQCKDGTRIWLTGCNRAKNVKVGDSGTIGRAQRTACFSWQMNAPKVTVT